MENSQDTSRQKFEQFRAKPQFDVWRISQQQAFKIFDAGWQARGRLLEEENRDLRAKLAEKEELIKSLTRAEIAATVERERLRNGS
jgi:hypothetical protein